MEAVEEREAKATRSERLFAEGRSLAEISAAVGWSVQTVRRHLGRAGVALPRMTTAPSPHLIRQAIGLADRGHDAIALEAIGATPRIARYVVRRVIEAGRGLRLTEHQQERLHRQILVSKPEAVHGLQR